MPLASSLCSTVRTLRPCLRPLRSRGLRTTPLLRSEHLCAPEPASLHHLAVLHLPGLHKAAAVSSTPSSSAVLLSSSARLQSQATVIEPPPTAAGASGPSSEDEEPATQPQPAKAEEPEAQPADENSWLRFLLPLLDLGLLLAGALCTLGAVAVAVSIPARSAALLKAASSGALTLRGIFSVLGAVQLQATLRVLASLFLITAGDRTKRRLKHDLFRSVLAQAPPPSHPRHRRRLLSATLACSPPRHPLRHRRLRRAASRRRS